MSPSSPLPPFNADSSLVLTQPPQPNWKVGQGVLDQDWKKQGEEIRKTWDMNSTSPQDAYKLLTSSIVPRPIAFVSSLSNDGVPNLSPFSYFSMISHNPPLISVSFRLTPARPKDSRENILANKEFTVSIISEPLVEAANASSVEAPADVDEWILSGLTMVPSTHVKPAYVKESAVSMECELYSFHDISPPDSSEITTTLVLGLVKKIHIRNSVLDESGNGVDPSKLRPVARLGNRSYARLLDVFDLPRISWETVVSEYEDLKANPLHD
ncbi:hypothetical protein D9615_004485 [Tricholomella constricta]|uniref:Flavin reductase like domain-containing protein n=1 Tax=Tricholomella constricta TaxID=117010 RepID=A0A8H5HC46_9AGAR|nr:hypothetical protein D9615_004485 [Tricholomella constricta]